MSKHVPWSFIGVERHFPTLTINQIGYFFLNKILLICKNNDS